MIDISVIIPTYKPGKYIEQCLLSLRDQSLGKDRYEIIVVLNGCYNPWYEYINHFMNGIKNNIRLIHTNEGGVSNARNIGIENSHGRYIAFIDDDDYVSPHYLESLLAEATENNMVLSDTLSFDDVSLELNTNYSLHKTYKRYRDDQKLYPMKVRHLLNGPCMKLIPRKVIGDIRFDTRFRNGEDSLFIFNILRNIKEFRFTDSNAIYYRRIREGSAVTQHDAVSYIIKNAFAINHEQLKIYFKHIRKYNCIYMFIRFFATYKGAIYRILKIG